MDKVRHLWSAYQCVGNLKCEEAKELQTYYVKCCERLRDEVELPKQCFGPSTMCSHCGVLWSTVDHTVRILPGKRTCKSIKKITSVTNNVDQVVPKVRRTLIKKCMHNEMKKIVIKCSCCSFNTEVLVAKVERLKAPKSDNIQVIKTHKRKKNKKDKTAGLIISGASKSPVITKKQCNADMVEKSIKTLNAGKSNKTQGRKLNINKLKDIVYQGMTPIKKNNIRNFLSELY